MTLSGATTPGQSGPGNKRVLYIPQNSSITGASPSYLFSIISRTLIGGVLPLYRDAVGVFCSPSQQGHNLFASQYYSLSMLDKLKVWEDFISPPLFVSSLDAWKV